jgi:uncharacterized membrane protein
VSPFLAFNAVWFAVWIAINLPGSPLQFDPFPSSFLTIVVSLEAIFLATFVLVAENAQGRAADRRARIDSLLVEGNLSSLLVAAGKGWPDGRS